MRTLMIWALAGAIAGALVLGGCSGAGVSAFDARGGSLQTLAADHLAALVLVRSWLVALHSHPAVSGQLDFTREDLPDGSMRVVGTNSDGSTFDVVLRPDGSSEGMWQLPDGTSFTETVSAPVTQGAVTTAEVRKSFTDGPVMDYAYTVDVSGPGVRLSYDGSATLPGGRAMDFSIAQFEASYETVALALPDGSACEYRAPLRREGIDWDLLDYAGEVAGHYVNPGGNRTDFALTGRGSRWVGWDLVAPDGTTAQFTLAPDYAGDGTLVDDGRVLAALRWDADATGVLDLLGAQSAEVGPSGAALDFAIDRWIENAALLGPAPMY